MARSFLPEPGTIPAMSARELRTRIASSELTARSVAEALLSRIATIEKELHAFAWHDPNYVLDQADALDAWQRAGRTLGPLHGVPVGLKDIIDTAGIPTEYGSPAKRGHVPDANAEVVDRLHSAGAIIMGKTVTTELAFMHPGPTRNPLNTSYSPGGSSSGSAAAVAAGMVPLAIGTQTGGSVTRPASFCGIIGFKPSFGTISRRGVLMQSQSLDTIGVFARTLHDAALLADVLRRKGNDDSTTASAPSLALATIPDKSDSKPRSVALVRLPGVAEEHYTRLRTALCDIPENKVRITECSLPEIFDDVAKFREQINFAEMAHNYAWLEASSDADISDVLHAALEAGRKLLSTQYLKAIAGISRAQKTLFEDFAAFDAIMSTATAGPAPMGLESTGTAICNGLWTAMHAPAVNVPLPADPLTELATSIQVSALKGEDAAALKVAAELYEHFR